MYLCQIGINVWGFSSSRYSKYLFIWGSLFLIMNFEIFSCVRTIVCVLITISRYSFGQEKTTIFMVIQYMSHIQYILLVVLMWDLESSWRLALCNTIFCLVTNIKVLLHVRYLQNIPYRNHWLLFLSAVSEYVNFKISLATLSQSKHASTWAICISA
jgi:hypothetical protein